MKCLHEYVKNCKILHLIIIKSITCYLGRLISYLIYDIYYSNTKERKPHWLQKIIKVGKSLKIN